MILFLTNDPLFRKTGLANWKGRMVLAWAFPEPESATPGEYGPQQSTLTKDLPALLIIVKREMGSEFRFSVRVSKKLEARALEGDGN